MGFIIHFLKRFISFATFYLASFPSRISQFIKIRILQQHKEVKVYKSFKPNSYKNVAVVALFPRGNLITSTLRLVESLIEANYFVITVVNQGGGPTEAWLAAIAGKNVTILVRPNIGRDFGAYQLGINYLQKQDYFEKVENLVIANDSMYYLPRSKKFLADLLADKSPWVSMFVNYQFQVHAQSFFIKFNRPVFTHKNFIKYWEHYYPTNSRYHVIENGEKRFSATLIKTGFYPKAFVIPEMLTSAKSLTTLTPDEKFALWGGYRYLEIDELKNPPAAHSLQIDRIFREQNATHLAGLIATRILGAPLKLDLGRQYLLSLTGIVRAAESGGIAKGELEIFREAIDSQGSASSFAGLTALWRQFGHSG
jgi:lipopolysaccharide biosynthesis protein